MPIRSYIYLSRRRTAASARLRICRGFRFQHRKAVCHRCDEAASGKLFVPEYFSAHLDWLPLTILVPHQ